MDCLEQLKLLTTSVAVTGYEKNLSGLIRDMFQEYCDTVEVDRFYNVIGLKKGNGTNKKKIMLTAHLDEIGFLVKSIDDRGFIRIAGIGGMDPKILPAHEVVVHGKKDLIGIIGAKPPHLQKPEEAKKALKLQDLSVDMGMSKERVKEFVRIGDLVTLKASPVTMQGKKFSSKSVDNRSGVVVLLQTMKELQGYLHENDFYFVATAQEELELTGAMTVSYNLEPDIAIVVDAGHGDMPDCPKDKIFPLGKGPAIGVGPNLHKKLTKQIIETAKDENIPYQIDVEPGDTGTEAWATQVSRKGIPTILVSIPVRYMHTAIETVHEDDIKNAARLCARFIVKQEEELEAMLCY